MGTIGERSLTLNGGKNTGATFDYLIHDAADEDIALALVKAFAPTTREIDGILCNRDSFDVAATESDTIWDGTARYVEPEKSERTSASEPVLTGSTTGGTLHITQALDHLSSRKAAGDAGDPHNGAIGVNNDSVEGTDIVVPADRFTVSRILDDDDVTEAYIDRLDDMMKDGAVTNDKPYTAAPRKKGEAGELLFLGYDYTKRGKGDWDFVFHFAKSKNVTDQTIGGISGIDKPGHAYRWIEYEGDVDDAIERPVKNPIAVHVEQVYGSDNFDKLDPNWV